MQPVPDTWTVVVVGAWDVRLFTPEWLTANLFGTNRLDVEMQVGPGSQTCRILTEDVFLAPSPERLMVGARTPAVRNLTAAERAIADILAMLPHTPVAGAGINIGIEIEAPTASLLELFDFSDNQKLGEMRYVLELTEICRSMRVPGWDAQVNLKYVLREGRVFVEFNHHFQVNSAQTAAQSLRGAADRAHQMSIGLLDNLYGLSLGGVN